MVTTLNEQVEKWLRQMGYQVMDKADQNPWHLVINHPRNTPHEIHLVGPREVEDAVAIVTQATMSPEHLEAFERLDDGERASFLFELKRALNQLAVEYTLAGANGAPLAEDECPRHFQVSVTRFADGLTKDGLFRSIGDVFKTMLAGIMVVRDRLGGEPGPQGRFDFNKMGF